MPKLKTKKSVAKRVRLTGKGKWKHMRAHKGHILTKKDRSRKRRLRCGAYISKVDAARIHRALPYG